MPERRFAVTPRAAGFVAVLGGWVGVYAIRLRDGFSNVDDYLYAAQAAAFRHGVADGPSALADAWRTHNQNSPLVPTLGAPVTALTESPHALVLIQLPLLVLLWVGLRELGRQVGLGDRAAWVTAAVVAVSPAVVGYAAMWHFAIAATAALVWALVAYLRSERLRVRRAAAAFGVLVGLLALSRVVAVVYVAALAAVCAVDLVLDRADLRRRAGNLLLAVGACGVVAGPWWAVAGRRAVRYLRSAGYDPDSGFTSPHTSPLHTEWTRLRHTALETGLVVTVLLVALLAAALVPAIRNRDRAVLLPAAVALLGMVGLGTSGNPGTAFALPLTAVAGVVAATVVRRRDAGLAVVAVAAVATLGQLGVVPSSAVGGVPVWVEAYPGRGQAYGALGAKGDLSSAHDVNSTVARLVANQRVLLVRDDAILNAQSLAANLDPAQGAALRVAPFGATSIPAADLAFATAVVAGRSHAPYHAGLDPDGVDAQLRAAGFTPQATFVLSDANDVVVWRLP